MSGAAMGFATGFAGGKGTLDDVLNNMWQGAVVGLLVGAALGAASYMLKPPGDLTTTMGQKLQPQAGAGQMPNPGGGPTAAVAPYSTNSLAQAGQYLGQGMAGKALGAAGMWLLQLGLTGPAAPVAETLLVDAASGAWDLYGIKLLYAVGVQGTSGSW